MIHHAERQGEASAFRQTGDDVMVAKVLVVILDEPGKLWDLKSERIRA